MSRLKKADVERLVDSYDADPVAALADALRIVLDAAPGTAWTELLATAPFGSERQAALASGDQRALDELLVELNEQRSVAPGSR